MCRKYEVYDSIAVEPSVQRRVGKVYFSVLELGIPSAPSVERDSHRGKELKQL